MARSPISSVIIGCIRLINWIGAVQTTIKDAQVRVLQGNEIIYFRSYAKTVHKVVVERDKSTGEFMLVSQYPVHLQDDSHKGAIVDKVREATSHKSREVGKKESP